MTKFGWLFTSVEVSLDVANQMVTYTKLSYTISIITYIV
jgi:hypothetical protein